MTAGGSCRTCGATGLLDGAKFCHECGAPTITGCSSCGESLVPGAKFCSSCGASQTGVVAAPAAPPPARTIAAPVAARRITTVLFGDLVGFTSLSEVRDTEEVRELLSRYFEECRRIIGRYGGTVEKFIGDAVMAVWGVPTAHEDDAERAVRAGLELARMANDLGEDIGIEGLAMRVGLVTGEVAVTIGAEQQGMVAGDAVNTASRVQSAANPGEVWVDETTKLLTSAAVSYVDAGSHTLKGKAEPMALWAARAVIASVGGAARADGLEAPFVGRDRELRLVKELFHSTAENARAALLVVDGEPGVGKSRLGWEFFKYVDGLSASVFWHQGRCLAYGEGVAFWALAEAVRLRLVRLAEHADDDEELDAAVLVSDGLAALSMTDDERAWMGPRVAALLGGASIGTFARDELFAAWVTFFERVSGGTEVVFLVDDAHHADDGLLAFVEYLLEAATFPCLVVLLTRPGLIERRPALATNRRSAVLHLPELESKDMSALVNGLVSGLPEDISAALVDRAEGIPLYAVETVRSLIDRDLVLPRGGQYVLANPDIDLTTIGAPASLQTLIAARLDALSVEQRYVVNEASILGATFELDALRVLCPGIDVDAAVTELVRLQILTKDTMRLSVEFGQLKFVQSVVRQVAYATLSRRDRKAGHLAAARYLQSAVEPGTEIDAVIAQHFLDAKEAMPSEPDVADLESAAIDLLLAAAERAMSLGVPDDASAHLRTALDNTSDTPLRAEVQRRLARASLQLQDWPGAMAQAEEATKTFDALGDRVSAARSVATWAHAVSWAGDPARAIEMARERFEEMQSREDGKQAALDLAAVLGGAMGSLGEDTLQILDTRLRLADAVGDINELADSLAALSLLYANTSAVRVSRIYQQAANSLAKEHQLMTPLARSLVNFTADMVGVNLADAIELGREAIAASIRAGSRNQQAFAIVNLAVALNAAGRWDELDVLMTEADPVPGAGLDSSTYFAEAMAALHRGLPAPPLPDHESWTSTALSDIAWYRLADAAAELTGGDARHALELASDATMLFYNLGGTFDDFVHAWPLAGQLAVDLGETERLDELLALVDLSSSYLSPAVLAHHAHLRGLRARDGTPESVEPLLREAIERYDSWRSPLQRARAQADLVRWLRLQGRGDEAEQLLADARSTLSDLGATRLILELDASVQGVG
ncbi:MAG TPA: adenylate/guanylate cyclase domain-containing protein [Nocardioidaceae bacterium]|nr:adenylate/guanylate cyclase domain-containing protein [Nocardioidaceae bacterium]